MMQTNMQEEHRTIIFQLNKNEVFVLDGYDILFKKQQDTVRGCECMTLNGNSAGCLVTLPGTMIATRKEYVN